MVAHLRDEEALRAVVGRVDLGEPVVAAVGRGDLVAQSLGRLAGAGEEAGGAGLAGHRVRGPDVRGRGPGEVVVEVADDGIGMDEADATAAFLRHATSKISAARDLEAITTLGFRGEALPSIASVSRLRLISRHAEASAGCAVEVDGGVVGAITPADHPRGTTVEVRDLFFNVPARRRFLRSERTEFQHLLATIERIALSRFSVAFRVAHNRKVVLERIDAERTVLSVNGVKGVVNQLEVKPKPRPE